MVLTFNRKSWLHHKLFCRYKNVQAVHKSFPSQNISRLWYVDMISNVTTVCTYVAAHYSIYQY